MRVLWITNVPIPLVAQDANLSITPYGGWLVQLADRIRETDEISLSMLFAQNEKKDEVTGRIDGIDYYGFYKGRFAENKEKRYKEFENFILSNQT